MFRSIFSAVAAFRRGKFNRLSVISPSSALLLAPATGVLPLVATIELLVDGVFLRRLPGVFLGVGVEDLNLYGVGVLLSDRPGLGV